jgi:hypothetical protein
MKRLASFPSAHPHIDPVLSQVNPVRTLSRYLGVFITHLLQSPIYTEINQAVSSLQVFPPNRHMHFPSPRMCYMISPSHPA